MQNAEDDDVIQLSAQLYSEGEEIVLDKEVTVIGTVDEFGNPTSRIDGQGLHRVMRSTRRVALENIIITRGHADRGGGYLNDESTSTFNNCRFDDNVATEVGAACLTGYSTEFTRCQFNNHVSVPALAAYGEPILPPISQCRITDCTFSNNDSSLFLYYMNFEIDGCTFTENNATFNGGSITAVDSSGRN